jgi:hypothetical protein
MLVNRFLKKIYGLQSKFAFHGDIIQENNQEYALKYMKKKLKTK